MDSSEMFGIPKGEGQVSLYGDPVREARAGKKTGQGHEHNAGVSAGPGRPMTSDGGGDSDSGGAEVTQIHPELTDPVEQNENKLGLTPEDRYQDNAGHNSYDFETAARHANAEKERIEKRANEIASSRISDEGVISPEEKTTLIEKRAKEIAVSRFELDNAKGEALISLHDLRSMQGYRGLLVREEKRIFKEKTGVSRARGAHPEQEDWDAAEASLLESMNKPNSEGPVVTDEDRRVAEAEIEANPILVKRESTPTAADYSQAEKELRPVFEQVSVLNAAKHAEVMQARGRKGRENQPATAEDYQATSDAFDMGAVKADKIMAENKLPIEEVLKKAGKSKAEIAAFVKGISDGEFDEEALRGLSEIPPSDQRTRAQKITDAMELSAKHSSSGQVERAAWRAHSFELDKLATLRADETELGGALKEYITTHPGDKDSVGLRRTWRGHERDILSATFDIQSIYGKLEEVSEKLILEPRNQHEMTLDYTEDELFELQKDQQLLEAELKAALERLHDDRGKFEDTTQKIAKLIGYDKGLPTYLSAKEIDVTEASGIVRGELANGEMMSMLRESMKNGKLTRGALEFFRKAGILEYAEDAFEQIYVKNWRTYVGENLQTLFGGRGNEILDETYFNESGQLDEKKHIEAYAKGAQIFKEDKLFEQFMESEQGYMCLDRLAESMQATIINADQLRTAITRPAESVSPNEILELFSRRASLQGEILARQRGVRTEVAGQAAWKAWEQAVGSKGEFTNAVRSILAKVTGSDQLLDQQSEWNGDEAIAHFLGMEWQHKRVGSRYSFRDIVENGSNKIAKTIQQARVGFNQIVAAMEYIDPMARAFEHGVITETPRALGAKKALNLHHEKTRDSQGRSQERDREVKLRIREVRKGVDRIVSNMRGRNAA